MRDNTHEQRDPHHLRHDDETASVVRHEEQLFVDTRPVETGRVRVSKRIVTEQHTITVRREELVVEELPADPSARADVADTTGNPAKAAAVDAAQSHRPTAQPGHTEGERPVAEIVLHEEQVVTRVVPIERVRVFLDRVTREQTVSDDLRKEVVTLEGDGLRESQRDGVLDGHDHGEPDYDTAKHRR